MAPHLISLELLQDALVQKVAGANSNTIVVVNSVGPIIMEAWVNHPNITAIVRNLDLADWVMAHDHR